jgi:hypothetical protein
MICWERNEIVPLEEVKDTHSKEFSDNANMVSIVKTVLQMNAFPKIISHDEQIVRGLTLCLEDHFVIR